MSLMSNHADLYTKSTKAVNDKKFPNAVPRQDKEKIQGRITYLRDLNSVVKTVRSLKVNFIQEHVILIVFDVDRKLLYKEVIFKGGLTSSIIDQKVLFNRILKFDKARGFILAHNHTSEDLTPSLDDVGITEKLKQSSRLLELLFLDHLILC